MYRAEILCPLEDDCYACNVVAKTNHQTVVFPSGQDCPATPPPGPLPDPEITPESLALAGGSFTTEEAQPEKTPHWK